MAGLFYVSLFGSTVPPTQASSALLSLVGGRWTDGPWIQHFEDQVANRLGGDVAVVSFAKGRMGLYAILEALDIRPDDEVILPAYTCVVVPQAVVWAGARPVYADIDRVTYNLDFAAVEAAITPRTRAIIVQHTFGLPCDLAAFARLAEKHGVALIEDACHALGAEYDGRSVGTLGDAAFFSMESTKVISSGIGGIATTLRPDLARKIRATQQASPFLPRHEIAASIWRTWHYSVFLHPRIGRLGNFALRVQQKLRLLYGSSRPIEYKGGRPTPYPAKLANPNARLAARQFDRLPEVLDHQRTIARWLDETLPPERFEKPQPIDTTPGRVYTRYPVLVEDKRAFSEAMDHAGIQMGDWFNSPLHPINFEKGNLGYRVGQCPVTEDVVDHNINFPTHRGVSIGLLQQRLPRVLEKTGA